MPWRDEYPGFCDTSSTFFRKENPTSFVPFRLRLLVNFHHFALKEGDTFRYAREYIEEKKELEPLTMMTSAFSIPDAPGIPAPAVRFAPLTLHSCVSRVFLLLCKFSLSKRSVDLRFLQGEKFFFRLVAMTPGKFRCVYSWSARRWTARRGRARTRIKEASRNCANRLQSFVRFELLSFFGSLCMKYEWAGDVDCFWWLWSVTFFLSEILSPLSVLLAVFVGLQKGASQLPFWPWLLALFNKYRSNVKL